MINTTLSDKTVLKVNHNYLHITVKDDNVVVFFINVLRYCKRHKINKSEGEEFEIIGN